MVSTRNRSKSQTNPLRMQDQHDVDDGKQLENVRVASPLSRHFDANNEMETLRLDNQSLLGEVAELTKILQRPQGARLIHTSKNTVPQRDGDPPSRQPELARGSRGTHQNITTPPRGSIDPHRQEYCPT